MKLNKDTVLDNVFVNFSTELSTSGHRRPHMDFNVSVCGR